MIIFLDLDGVIRLIPESDELIIPAPEFSVSAKNNLAQIVSALSAKIVISSDLRQINDMEETNNSEELISQLSPQLDPSDFHEDWATPIRGHRWKEITMWLEAHPEVGDDYCVIDDFMPHFQMDGAEKIREHLYLCSSRYGLTQEMVEKIIHDFQPNPHRVFPEVPAQF